MALHTPALAVQLRWGRRPRNRTALRERAQYGSGQLARHVPGLARYRGASQPARGNIAVHLVQFMRAIDSKMAHVLSSCMPSLETNQRRQVLLSLPKVLPQLPAGL